MRKNLNTLAKLIDRAFEQFMIADEALSQRLSEARSRFETADQFGDWLDQNKLMDETLRKLYRE